MNTVWLLDVVWPKQTWRYTWPKPPYLDIKKSLVVAFVAQKYNQQIKSSVKLVKLQTANNFVKSVNVYAFLNSFKDKSTSCTNGPENAQKRLDGFERFVGKYPDNQNVIEYYNQWSKTYEDDINSVHMGYNHPEYLAILTNKYVTKKHSRILDVCCGTGLSAQFVR